MQRTVDSATIAGTGSCGVCRASTSSGNPGCVLAAYPDGLLDFQGTFALDPAGPTHVVVLLGSSTVVTDTGPPADEDGVPDVVEAQGPNNGDGNGDGIPDYEQDYVTSLPAAGGGVGDPYVTIEGPPGATLADVSTLALDDPSVTTPAPAGLTLPDGLLRFRLEDLTPGSSHIVSIFSSQAGGLTGYAKYHDNAWTTLPTGRVSIAANRVDVTLTDGGIGDDDGVADGTIVDPGGPSYVDATPPTVALTGVAAGKQYVLGKVPTPTCAASDAGGLAGPCQVTVTGGNAAGVGSFTARARAVDKAGNAKVVTAAYRVVYRFGGFRPPVVKASSSKPQVLKAGKKVAVAFTLLRANGAAAKPAGALRWMKPERGAPLSKPAPKKWKGTSPTGSAFKASGATWRYDWATKKLKPGYWYRIGVLLDDGTTQYVTVGLTKPAKPRVSPAGA